jgi:hypothetical protein
MKICNTCSELKDLELFFRNKNTKDGRHSSCKGCQNKSKKYDKVKRSEYYNNTKDRDFEKIKIRRRNYYLNNKEKENKLSKEYKEKNKEKINKYAIDYYYSNKDTERYKEVRKNYYKNRLDNDILYKIRHYLTCMLGIYFRNHGFTRKTKTYEILGCSFEDFKLYLENKFEPWMTWENRGLYNGEVNYGWDIDHIIPISSAKTEEDIIKLNHYTNLRPLCSYVNRVIKKDKLDF